MGSGAPTAANRMNKMKRNLVKRAVLAANQQQNRTTAEDGVSNNPHLNHFSSNEYDEAPSQNEQLILPPKFLNSAGQMQPFSDRKSPGAQDGKEGRYRNSNQAYSSLQESERTKSMNMTTVSPRRNNNNMTGRRSGDYEPAGVTIISTTMSSSAADTVRPTNVMTAHSKSRFRTIEHHQQQFASPLTRQQPAYPKFRQQRSPNVKTSSQHKKQSGYHQPRRGAPNAKLSNLSKSQLNMGNGNGGAAMVQLQ